MRLREQTPGEIARVALLRARLRETHGAEADDAPYITRWSLVPGPGGRQALQGLCWGHPVHGDQLLTTSEVVELGEGYARMAHGRLYLLGSEDREHRRRRTLAGRRGPLRIAALSSDPEPEESMLRKRYPNIRLDLSGLDAAPLLDEWRLEPDAGKADGAVLVGVISGDPRFPNGERITTSPVQAIDAAADEGWAFCYATGLLRLGRPFDLEYSREVSL